MTYLSLSNDQNRESILPIAVGSSLGTRLGHMLPAEQILTYFPAKGGVVIGVMSPQGAVSVHWSVPFPVDLIS